MNKSELFHFLSSTTLLLALGLIIGYSAGYFHMKRSTFAEFQNVGEINPGIATVKLMKLEDGNLGGEIIGKNVRLVYSPDNILELEKGESFEIPLSDIHLSDFFVTEDLPEGTQFIASKSGKYYYSVFDKKAFSLTPANRIYFNSATEAEKAGYIAK